MTARRIGRFRALLALCAAIALTNVAAAQDKKLKVALHWNAPNAAFIPYYAAIKQGFYKEQRLDIELMTLPGSVPAVTAVANANAELGQAGSDAILVGIGNRAPHKAIFLLYQRTPAGVITFKESNIRGFADLKGKSISTSVASPEGIMLKARLKEVGLDAERDVRILNVAPGAKLTMQLNGQADTSTGFVNFQLIQAELAGRNVAFLPFSTPAEPLYGHAVFANATWLDRNPDDAKRFVAATVKGIAWARDNVDKAVDLVVTWDTSLNIDRNFIKRDWEAHLAQLMGSDLTARSGIGHMEQAGWANLARLLSEGGVVTGQVDPAAIFTNAFIPSDAPKWK